MTGGDACVPEAGQQTAEEERRRLPRRAAPHVTRARRLPPAAPPLLRPRVSGAERGSRARGCRAGPCSREPQPSGASRLSRPAGKRGLRRRRCARRGCGAAWRPGPPAVLLGKPSRNAGRRVFSWNGAVRNKLVDWE